MAAKGDGDDESLKRLGGGRWQTRDERFTIEPQSGTWAVVDADETDDFGLPLVRGPFGSLTAAKAAIAAARSSEPATSPLAGRVAKDAGQANEPRKVDGRARAGGARAGRARAGAPEPDEPASEAPTAEAATRAAAKKPEREAADESRREPEAEPSWIADLSASDRGRARRLIGTLQAAGIPDAEGVVRRDLAGGVAALAAVAVARRIAELGDDAKPDAVAAAVAEGRDDALGVRWRLVDGDGRPILVEPPRGSRAAKR